MGNYVFERATISIDNSVMNQPTSPSEFVTRRYLNPDHDLPAHVHDTWGLPHYGNELTSHSAELRVTVLNFGERQPGAENVLIKLSRPVLGQQTFHTTNGDASFSASGALLLVQTPFLLISLDAHTMQPWHFALPNRTMLISASWQSEQLTAQMMPYGQRIAQPLGPWSWTVITKQWQSGLGRAAEWT